MARITRAVLRNEDVVLPVSALVDGQYGRDDDPAIYIGTPAVINRRGIREVIELGLDDTEQGQFDTSADTLQQVMDDAGVFRL